MFVPTLATAVLLAGVAAPQTQPSLTPSSVAPLLSARRPARDLVERFRAWMGEASLRAGTAVRVEDRSAAFAIEIAEGEAEPKVVGKDGAWVLPLKRLGASRVYAAATVLEEGFGTRWHFDIGGQRRGGGEIEAYDYPPETKEQPGVPKGKLIQQPQWTDKVFGAKRDWWVYVPAQYDPTKPACVLVVQDGQWSRGYWPVVLDNLIAKKDIPVTIAVFLTPGGKANALDNRSFEYDSLSDRYARLLLDEILPEMSKTWNLRQDARGRMITGLSSGGICAFTAAWERPDAFHKVLSWIGSFTNLQGGPTGTAGGNTYPAIIRRRAGWDRKGEPKPIRVYLQDGSNDLDNAAGSWPIANQDMAAALRYAGYDFMFRMGQGFHSDKHGRALLPEAMRWLWRDEPK